MIRTSEQIDQLAVALGRFQANLTPIAKDATNPHLKNRYASLTHIMNEIRPLLADQELAISQGVIGGDGQIGVVTRVMHASGQWQEAAILIPIGDTGPGRSLVQEVGSKLTYLRRYSLSGALGLVIDEDDDGEQPGVSSRRPGASQRPAKQEKAGNGRAPKQNAASAAASPTVDQSAYWDSLGPVERACYRSWDNVRGAVGGLTRYNSPQAVTGVIRKLYPGFTQNGYPTDSTPQHGRIRVSVYRTIKAYAELRDDGVEGDEASVLAFETARNTAAS